MKLGILYQRVEGAAILAAAVSAYLWLDFKWWWLLVFILAVDVFMLGYVLNNRVGAHIYNIGHSFIAPAVLLSLGAVSGTRLMIGAGLIWLAHIGMDRMAGYGLKEESGFKSTHLGRIGK